MSTWSVYAVKYAERNARRRSDSFIFDDNHDAPHAMDYFMWVLRNGDRTILVDCGYDEAEGARRGRPIQTHPAEALAPLGIAPSDVDELVVTHLHYDHIGGLDQFPNAKLYVQQAEMAFATGPCMCHEVLRMPYTAEHICNVVHRLYAGKLIFIDGEAEIAPGITVHKVGGHSQGLQCVRVRTQSGWMVLASDASHYYENFELAKPFPIVVNLEDMLAGFETLKRLASVPSLIIPGHDPLVRTRFPQGSAEHISRLDVGPRS